MRRTMLVIAVALAAPGLDAQEVSRRLSFTASAGVLAGGPGSDMGSQLIGVGFGYRDPGGCEPLLLWVVCSDPEDYPQAEPGAGGTLTIRYEFTRRWAVSVGVATGTMPTAVGNSALDEKIYVSWRGSARWLTGHFKPTEWLALGLGPGHYRFQGEDSFSYSTSPRSTSRVGLASEVALRLPARSRFFIAATARTHVVPGSLVLSYVATSGDPFVGSGPIVPLTHSFGYSTVEVGIGFRM